jgi:flagellar protein FliO/FliZ
MAVSLVSNVRQMLLAGTVLLLSPGLALAQAQVPPQPAAVAPAPAQPKAATPAPAQPAASVPTPTQPAAPTPAPAQPSAPSEPPASATTAPGVTPGSELPDPFAAEPTTEEPESLGWMLLRTLLLLGAVLAFIYLTLNVGLRRLMGLQGATMGRQSVVTVLERVPLDQRRTLFVLKAAEEYLLVGGGEGGLQLLSKLDAQAVERIRAEGARPGPIPISPFLKKLLSRRPGPTPPQS